MKIYSMTATFGSLEHQTLTLKPGLNVIEAPNEWGKSTWCAFLVNMLYGLDTRAKSTKTALADKDRYAPWSGAPMSGRIDLNWNGRDITIERRTQGRLLFGEFSAYETATGLEIPELNGNNCGTVLLGVERSVFTRAGFLKLTDLPVTQDEALRRRLNSLVTTGDESGAGDKLYQALKDLKNKCRFNRTGLLPQAEAQRNQLENQLHEFALLAQQKEALTLRQTQLEAELKTLENHKAHLLYADSLSDMQKLTLAQQAQQEALAAYTGLESHCQGLPSRQEAEDGVKNAQELQAQWIALQTESNVLPPLPQPMDVPVQYQAIHPEQAVALAQEDTASLEALKASSKRRKGITAAVMAGIFAVVAAAAVATYSLLSSLWPMLGYGMGAALLAGEILALSISGASAKKARTKMQAICQRHPNPSPNHWIAEAQAFARNAQAHQQATAEVSALRKDLDQRMEALQEKITAFTKDATLSDALAQWQQISQNWLALEDAKRELAQADAHLETLQSMVKPVDAPKTDDTCAATHGETDARLAAVRFELHQLGQKLGLVQGRSEALGQEALIRAQLRTVQLRIHKLEDTYAALELAQQALSTATTELQRRFAPRITKRAQSLFAKLTNNRYDRFAINEDLSVQTCTDAEDTLRAAFWRSDGTVDQLYLALRLAVAEELTPDAPLILDDALVRFDDTRLASALHILQETANTKQVILFTCQGRESKLQGESL